MVKADCHKDCSLIPPTNDDPSPVNNDLPFLSLSDMIIPREKAEALLPILLVSCLRLNSSSSVVREHKSILAPIFAAAYFFNRAKILPFSIQSGRNKRGHMTPKAMSYLHGKLLMDLVTPCEEAFIRFVVLLDIMRYHPYSLEPLLEKYGILTHSSLCLRSMESFSPPKTKTPSFNSSIRIRNMELKRFNSIHTCTAGLSRDTVLRTSFYS